MINAPKTHGMTDTIFALASGSGRAGVSVFRVSGPNAAALIKSLTGKSAPAPRKIALRDFKDAGGAAIDSGLVLWMPSPGSFTGEDVAEFHTHGSPAVIEAMAKACLGFGARQAGPGEFTRRAFDNGRMDLTEAEGLADLIDAETDGQRKQALRQMKGGLRATYEDWRSELIDALAAIEGEIDFPDEGDIPDALSHAAYAPIKSALSGMEEALSDGERGERIRAGLDIAIIGPPNAGKSTLTNYLAGRDAAIVSDVAGTTRDIIDVHMVIAGLPVRLSDTAGLRESLDLIEAEGVKRAKARSQDSDIVIAMIDPENVDMKVFDGADPDFIVINKIDLKNTTSPEVSAFMAKTFPISAATGEGVAIFRAALEEMIKARFAISQSAGLTRARHRDCVSRAADALTRALNNLGRAPELSGDDIRAALHAIKELAGEADIEAVLDRIFSRFCVGK